uniref:Uncharacterized protein n=1 Tax=Agarophyton chilense TaxID=2510777 RepID=O49041_AGACH|nr:ORF4 [Agarophyton chilense]
MTSKLNNDIELYKNINSNNSFSVTQVEEYKELNKLCAQFSEISKKIERNKSMVIRKDKKRTQQRKYVKEKRRQGFFNLNFWIRCTPDTAHDIKTILCNLSEEDLNLMVEKYKAYL